ncbi:ExbD/TolR family protein [Paraliomyxa miuraensis]|uniref:ExbD/TolR family protein n=1 Tax=Paraliomyxa miuraensis TaxID=376150 RepID=UPI00225061D5|nr:biopolymer transporter ExbD [Paraliomyxa miuraensis]MCX4242158.1 biopolymer transporter ExbD [Paraliomyxa miuraensis]
MAGGTDFDDEGEITGINVTPLVDVTLVLLIIFMVTTSIITNPEGLKVDKPEAATGQTQDRASILIVCRKDGTTAVDGKEVTTDDQIVDAITDALVADRELQGIVQCDTKAEVGRMVHLIDLLRAAGVNKYAIATEKPPKEEG